MLTPATPVASAVPSSQDSAPQTQFGFAPPAGQGEQPQINVDAPKVELRAYFGMREIQDIVLDVLNQEMDRAGLGHGDKATAMAHF